MAVILRERLPDNYDPSLPWVVECDDVSEMHRISMPVEEWMKSVSGDTEFRGRKIGFSDEHEAALFLLRFA